MIISLHFGTLAMLSTFLPRAILMQGRLHQTYMSRKQDFSMNSLQPKKLSQEKHQLHYQEQHL